MAGIEDVYNDIYTVSPGGRWPLTPGEISWEPLTTPFTYSATCTENWRLDGYDPNPDFLSLSIPSSCRSSGGQSIHSPGTCLDGYRIANLIEFRTTPDVSGGPRVWAADCCRRYLSLSSQSESVLTTDSGFAWSGGTCKSAFSTPVTAYLPKQIPGTTTTSNSATFTFTAFDRDSRDNATVVTSGVMYMDAMLVYCQESDFSNFDRDYASSLAEVLLPSNTFTPTPTSTARFIAETASPPNRSQYASATAPAQSDSAEATDSSRLALSPGAKAGIGVGVVVGVILLCAGAFLLYRTRARTAKLDRKSTLQNEQPEFVQTSAA